MNASFSTLPETVSLNSNSTAQAKLMIHTSGLSAGKYGLTISARSDYIVTYSSIFELEIPAQQKQDYALIYVGATVAIVCAAALLIYARKANPRKKRGGFLNRSNRPRKKYLRYDFLLMI